jgi:hypothetical protein
MLQGQIENSRRSDLLQQIESEERADCLAKSQLCHRECVELASALDYVYGGEASRLVALLADCAEISMMLASSLTNRKSRFNRPLIELGVELTERCASECARQMDEAEAQACIAACAQFSASCRAMTQEPTLQ